MTTEDKALALLNELRMERGFAPVAGLYGSVLLGETLCRSIEQHEDFKQEVSDAVDAYIEDQPHIWKQSASGYFSRFIIPAPKPDPLVEAMADCGVDRFESWADQLRAALEARGLTITTKEKD